MSSSKDFPKVETTTTGNQAGGFSHSIVLPSVIQTGDLILIFFAGYSTAGSSVTLPAGYTRLYTTPIVSSLRFFEAFYKFADGTEGGSTITASTSSNTFTCYSVMRISGASDISASVSSNAGATAPNPPSHSPTWGSSSNLWVAGMAHSSYELSQTPPSEYSSNSGQSSLTTGGVDYVRLAWGTRNLIASNDDPSSFSGTPSGAIAAWIATTISIKPI